MLPVFLVKGKTLPETWEESIFKVWNEGILSWKESYKYGVKKDRIKECSMLLVIDNPLEEPRLHLGYQGLGDLKNYVRAVLEGSEDHLVGKTLTYTYHERHFNYRVPFEEDVNQIDYIVNYLKSTPYSNRCISVTWKPWVDESSEAPPCNIGVWFKVIKGKLIMETFWRSRDAWGAAFANIYAFTELQKEIARKLDVEIGQYVDYSTSYHIYQWDFPYVKKFIQAVKYKRRKGTQRYINSSLLDRWAAT